MKKTYSKEILTKEEWLEAKETTIGGSEAAAVINQASFLTKDDLFNKLIGMGKKVVENERMIEGSKAEEHIRELFALDTKFKVKAPPKKGNWFFWKNDKPYISCTPDGLYTRQDGSKWGLEIKDIEMRSKATRELWENNALPSQYFYQIIQYLLVLNDLDGVTLVAHLKYYKFDEERRKWLFDYAIDRQWSVYREEVKQHIEYLEQEETKFWEENVLPRKRPKLTISL